MSASASGTRIVFVVNEGSFFLSHRLPLAEEARARGYDVHVVCGFGTGEEALVGHGLSAHPIPFSRSGFNPLQEITTLNAITGIYRDLQPDIVHHVTIKPVLYGTTAARWSGVPAVVNAVPGMGFVFTFRVCDGREAVKAKDHVQKAAVGEAELQIPATDRFEATPRGLFASIDGLLQVIGKSIKSLGRDGLF